MIYMKIIKKKIKNYIVTLWSSKRVNIILSTAFSTSLRAVSNFAFDFFDFKDDFILLFDVLLFNLLKKWNFFLPEVSSILLLLS